MVCVQLNQRLFILVKLLKNIHNVLCVKTKHDLSVQHDSVILAVLDFGQVEVKHKASSNGEQIIFPLVFHTAETSLRDVIMRNIGRLIGDVCLFKSEFNEEI